MKNIILLLFITLCPYCFAHSEEIITPKNHSGKKIVLFSHVEAEQNEYDLTLNKESQFISYIEFKTNMIEKNPEQEENLFDLSRSYEKDPSDTIQAIKTFEAKEPLTITSLFFLYDFSMKYLDQSAPPEVINYLQELKCKTSVFIESGIPAECPVTKIDFKKLQEIGPKDLRVLIESKIIKWDSQDKRISSTSKYHWTLLSNSHKAISFYGRYDELLKLKLNFEELISGKCKSFLPNIGTFDFLIGPYVFFSKNCIKPILPSEEKNDMTQWFSENKLWIYPLSLIILGAGILKIQNKVLVIEKPF